MKRVIAVLSLLWLLALGVHGLKVFFQFTPEVKAFDAYGNVFQAIQVKGWAHTDANISTMDWDLTGSNCSTVPGTKVLDISPDGNTAWIYEDINCLSPGNKTITLNVTDELLNTFSDSATVQVFAGDVFVVEDLIIKNNATGTETTRFESNDKVDVNAVIRSFLTSDYSTDVNVSLIDKTNNLVISKKTKNVTLTAGASTLVEFPTPTFDFSGKV
jgi:hypothetical protein